jgi:hypothetical protein
MAGFVCTGWPGWSSDIVDPENNQNYFPLANGVQIYRRCHQKIIPIRTLLYALSYTHSPIRTLLYVTEHHHRYNPRAETSIPAALISATSNNQIETHLVPKMGGRYICSISVALQRAKSGTEPPRLSALLVLRFRRVGWVVFGKAGHRYIRPRRGCCLCDLGSLAEAGSSGCFPLKCREVFCLWRLCGRRLDTNT